MIDKFKKYICKLLNCNKEEWFNDIDWDNVSEEKTDIAYDSAILYLKDLEEAQKGLDSKALIFLSYLFTILGAILYNLFFNSENMKKFILQDGSNFYNAILIMAVGYSILFGWTAMIFLSTQKRKAKYGKPSSIFSSSNNSVQYIKNDLCIGLQEAISYNIKKQNRKSGSLKMLLFASVIFPICIISIYFFNISFLVTIIMAVISYRMLWFLFRFYP